MDDERLFPTLTSSQFARMAALGRRRAIARGDLLVDVGHKSVACFVVLSGDVQVLRPLAEGETIIVTLRAGQFSGESNMLTGRRAMARLRVSEAGEVVEISRE